MPLSNIQKFIAHIRELIAKDDFKTAIQQLSALLKDSPLLDEAVQQSACYNNVMKQIRLGLVDFASANIAQNQLRYGLLELLREIDEQAQDKPNIKTEVEHYAVKYEKNVVKNSTITAGGNVTIGDTKIIKGGITIALVLLLGLGFWQKEMIKDWLGLNRFFSANDQNFKILVLPFRQICEQNGKNYDAGFVVSERLNEITQKEKLKIAVHYWGDYNFVGFDDQNAKALREYHHADMIIFGAYETEACSGDGNQVCINYITDEKWKIGDAGLNLDRTPQKGGITELRTGKLQEKVENLAVFISVIAQVKNIDHEKYLILLKQLLEKQELGANSKANIYLEIADKLVEEGKLEEPLHQYENALKIYIVNNDKQYKLDVQVFTDFLI